jgi:hypothetical protein
MRLIARVSPVCAACRLRWLRTGMDGAWPIQVSAVTQTHPDAALGAKTASNRASPNRSCSPAIKLDPLRAPQHPPAEPTALPKSP